jgi:oligopeptide transport system permease protein
MKSAVGKPVFLAAAGFLILTTLAAITGPLWLPDPSPLANDICLPMASRLPGTGVNYVRFAPQGSDSVRSGKGSMIPLTNWSETADSVRLTLFHGEGARSTEAVFAKADLQPSKQGAWVEHRYFLLGTDRNGADLLSRLVTGGRISLGIGFCAVVISMFIGILAGLSAGYFGGKTDRAISWVMGVMWSIPSMLLALAVSFAMGRGFVPILVAIGLSTWVDVARMVRGQTLSVKEREFVLAAKVLGFSSLRIMLKHILPNLKGVLMVVATANFASAILLEAGLSFLGLGIPPPAPSWGSMVRDHYGSIVSGPVHLALIPGFAIMLAVMSFHVLSTRLRERWDARV